MRATSKPRDFLVLFWILGTLLLGLSTVPLSLQHSDGATMLKLMAWAQHIVTFRGDAAGLIADVSLVFKVHMAAGMTLFVIFTNLSEVPAIFMLIVKSAFVRCSSSGKISLADLTHLLATMTRPTDRRVQRLTGTGALPT